MGSVWSLFNSRGYKYEGSLGRGCFGEVWKYSKAKQMYAIKKLSLICPDPEMEPEIQTLVHLSKHDNVVSYYEYFIWGVFKKELCIVFEYCNAGNLNDYVQENNPSAEQTLDLTFQLCEAIVFLHDNDVIHRDLKPDNVMLQKQSRRLVAKLGDFGLARIWENVTSQHSEYYCISGSVMGPQFYTAPEIYSKKHFTQKSDIFSFGCLILGIFSKQTVKWVNNRKLIAPHTDKEVLVRQHVPEDIKQLVLNMVQEQWRNRPSAKECKNTLSDVVTALNVTVSTTNITFSNERELKGLDISEETKSNITPDSDIKTDSAAANTAETLYSREIAMLKRYARKLEAKSKWYIIGARQYDARTKTFMEGCISLDNEYKKDLGDDKIATIWVQKQFIKKKNQFWIVYLKDKHELYNFAILEKVVSA